MPRCAVRAGRSHTSSSRTSHSVTRSNVASLSAGAPQQISSSLVAITVLMGGCGDAGLRLGEILGLEWPDLDFARELVKVQRAVYQGQ